MNDSTEHWCHSCGHAAHKARMDCDCPRCLRLQSAGDEQVEPELPDWSYSGDAEDLA
jgi:hypothetical protein